jgi:DNA repair exonuclease SbcCD ATPase subunit
MAITPEQIIETAEALVERGASPTLAAVRQELGGGSFTTISEALRSWRERRQASQARAESVQVPARVQEALAEAGKLVWTEATRQHAAQLAAEREALDVERGRFEAERREAVELADQVSRDLDQVRIERDRASQALAQERQGHDQAHAEAREQRALAEERSRRNEALDADLRELRQRAGETSAELGQARGQLEALRGQLEEMREALASNESERDQARAAVQEAQNEAKEYVRRIQEQAATLDELRDQVAEAKAEGVRLSSALAKAHQDTEAAVLRAEAAETQARRNAEAHEAARTAQLATEKNIGELRLDVATLTERAAHIAELRTIIAALQVRPPENTGTDVPGAALEPAPEPKKKAASRRREQDPQGSGGGAAGVA